MVRALFSLSLLSATAAYQVADLHEHMDYASMKTALLSMAKHAQKEGINGGAITAINGFLKVIKDDLNPALIRDRDAAQASLDAAEDAVNKCNTDRNDWVTNSLSVKNTAVSGKNDDHNNCRKQEQVTFDNYTSYCQTLTDRVCGWTVCPQPSFAMGDTDSVNDYICCMHEFFNTNRVAYYSELSNCNHATALHHAQTARCDTDQEEYEAEFCSREANIQGKCSWYDDCRCAAEKEFEDIKKDVEDLEKIFQTQFVALQHLLCYGEQMLLNITDLSGCDHKGDDCEKDYSDCPEITYPTPEDFIPCSEPHKDHPCEESWISDNYGWISTDQRCTPVDDCIPCDNAAVIAGTYTGGRKQSYAACTPDDA